MRDIFIHSVISYNSLPDVGAYSFVFFYCGSAADRLKTPPMDGSNRHLWQVATPNMLLKPYRTKER